MKQIKKHYASIRLAAVTAVILFAITPAARSEERAPAVITRTQAVILGVVEGLTEYLPVSSTGHLILVADAMKLSHFAEDENGQRINGPLGPIMKPNPAINAFNIVIQIGAILAVVGIYFQRIREMANGVFKGDKTGKKLLLNLITAFMPAAVIGLLVDDKIEAYLFSPLTVALALAVGGAAMLFFEKLYNRKDDHVSDIHEITLKCALIIGFAQCIAMWPGTSRSMVTILAGMAAGLSITTAAEFSFLLALPTLGAATAYKMVTEWHLLSESVGLDTLLIGIAIGTIVAALSVKFLLHYLTRHGLMPFGIYRILLAIGVLLYFSGA